MNASASAPGSSGASRASLTRNSRPAFSSCPALPRYTSAGASPAWTGRGPRRTARSWRRAAAGPCHQSSPRPLPSQPPGTRPSDPRSPRIRRQAGRAPRPGHRARPAAPGPSPGPARRATRDSGHRTMRASSRGYATIAFTRCPSGLGDRSVRHSYRPSSEGTFHVDTSRNPYLAGGLRIRQKKQRLQLIRADLPWLFSFPCGLLPPSVHRTHNRPKRRDGPAKISGGRKPR